VGEEDNKMTLIQEVGGSKKRKRIDEVEVGARKIQTIRQEEEEGAEEVGNKTRGSLNR